MERAWKMSSFAIPQKVSIFKIGMIHFTGKLVNQHEINPSTLPAFLHLLARS